MPATEPVPDRADADPLVGADFRGDFGGDVRVRLEPLREVIDRDGVVYVPNARSWLVPYPESSLAGALAAYDPALHESLRAGLLVLYQKCPHLGCRVPQCTSSRWFECPCHGSMYSEVGEHRSGPGPRGLDAFPLRIDGDDVVIDTAVPVLGAAVGTLIVDTPAAGPHCIEAAIDT